MEFTCQYQQIEEKRKQVEKEKLHLFLQLEKEKLQLEKEKLQLEKEKLQLEQEKLHLEARVSAMLRGPLLSKKLQLEKEKLHLEESELALTDQLAGLGVLFREQDKRIVAQSQHVVEQNDQIRELKALLARFMEASGNGPVLETEELTPEQVDLYWSRLAAMKEQFESFARSYMKTLEEFKPEEPNPAQQKCVEKVRSYLFVFLKLCGESRESAKRKPSLKALDGCEKTLNAVLKRYGREVWLKRSARNRGVPGGSLVVDDKSIVGVERGLEINEASAPAQKKQKVAAAADGPVAVKAEVF